MAYIEFTKRLHTSTKRDYLERVVQHDKAACAVIAKKFGRDYWDGDRQHGYGGYRYDGRWRPVAEAMADHYGISAGDKILDVGCGKGYLLYELTQVVPGVEVTGIDISEYGLENSKEEIREHLKVASATDLPFPDNSFDYVVSLVTLHNLFNFEVWKALEEIERVGKDKKYVVMESYRNEQEKVNLLYWQLTCESFCTPQEWEWLFERTGYTGDHEFIFFE